MSAVEVAFGSLLPRRLPPWMTGVVAATTAFGAIVGLVLVYAGAPTYADIARTEGFESIPFHVPPTVPVEGRQAVRYDIETRVALHEATLRYVLSEGPGTPRDPTTREPLFDRDEQQHLSDVRGVFTGVRIGALVALATALALVWSGTRAGPTMILRLIRDAAGAATVIVALVALIFAFAFEPAFLAFHFVFFPQGNFLFDPATSNLLALYPEQYWYSVTLRIGITFILGMVAIALAGTVALRRRAAR